MVWAADEEIRRINFAALRLAEGRIELLVIRVYLFWVLRCHTHLPTTQLTDWSYNELNPNYMYVDTKKDKSVYITFRCNLC